MNKWAEFYESQMSYEEHLRAHYLRIFLKKIMQYWKGGTLLEVGPGTGYLSIYLSKNQMRVKAVDNDVEILERCRFSNKVLQGSAEFITCDAYELSGKFKDEKFDIAFHQGLFEHFSNENILKLIEEQFKVADYILFSVPSRYYPRQDFGDERLLSMEEWYQILEPYKDSILEAEYHGHTEDTREHLFFAIKNPHLKPYKAKKPAAKKKVREAGDVAEPQPKPEIVWESLVFHPSGYASIARNTVLGLDYTGVKVCLKPMTLTVKTDYDLETIHRLIHMIENKPGKRPVYVFHHPPAGHRGEDFFAAAKKRNEDMGRYIGSTMFETDRIPQLWVSSCNTMDEIWVPTQFNVDTFSRSGVNRDKLHVIPFGIDPKMFTRKKYSKIDLPGNKDFNFVSVFEWTKRKGWDVLLKAFLTEFDYRENVALTLFVYRGSGTDLKDKETITQKAYAYITQVLGIDPYKKPQLNIIEAVIPYHEMPGIYFSADAFILPTRGEGWGMPFMEAMTSGLPVIATRWSGQLEFMNDDNSYLIDIEGLSDVDEEQVKDNPYYAGHKWAEPSVESTKLQMREVFENRKESKEKGEYARQDILNNWTIVNTANKIEKRLLDIKDEKSHTNIPRQVIEKADKKDRLVWNAPVLDPSGYADDARDLILGIDNYSDIDVKINPINWSDVDWELDEKDKLRLFKLIGKKDKDGYINLDQIFPQYFKKKSNALYNIGRAFFETDRIPQEWVEKCNEMDELWIPSDFNVKTFSESGVSEEKIFKVPGCLNPEKYDPGAAPVFIPERKEFNFISVFDWSYRKGWDVLLRAFIEEFSPDEEVSLTLKTYSSYGLTGQDIQTIIVHYIKDTLGKDLERAARVVLMTKVMGKKELIRFYKSGEAFVLPTRGEGWGRPFMESMAMGLPTIGTRWSGNLEFMNDDNSFLIDCCLTDVPEEALREVPHFRGHRWAEPSVDHLKKLMRFVYTNYSEAARKGEKARRDILAEYSQEKIAKLIEKRIQDIKENDFKPPEVPKKAAAGRVKNAKEKKSPEKKKAEKSPTSGKKPSVVWEGSQFVYHSFGLVNREMCMNLIDSGRCNLSIKLYEKHEFKPEKDEKRYKKLEKYFGKKISGRPDFWIRHMWPPDFSKPDARYTIIMQPWEYGSIPADWLEPMNTMTDEIWVPSSFVKKCYEESGVNPEKIFVIHNGVNTDIFTPDVKPMKLKTGKSFKFIFVGGTIWRKGIDILLKVYSSLFTAEDDVCLVIKDMGIDTFYKGQNAEKLIEDIKKDKNSPEILYLEDMYPEKQIAALYKACNCLVHPFRGEGFGLPVAEAMACGLPVIVTGGGACDDFCTKETAYMLPAEKREVDIREKLVNNGWVLEPDAGDLAVWMKEVIDDYEISIDKGRKAAEYIRKNLTWQHTVERILERFNSVAGTSVKKEKKVEQSDFQKKLDEAKTLFESGENTKAYDKYKKLFNEYSDNPEILLGYGSVSFNLGKLEEAEGIFVKGVELYPDNPEFYNNLGCVLFQLNRFDEAEKNFKKSIELDNNLNARKNLANQYLQTKKYQEVIPVCEGILKEFPEEVETMVILGNCCYNMNMVKEAVALYQKALEIDPNFEDARENLEIAGKKLEST